MRTGDRELFSFLFFALFYTTYRLYSKSVAFFSFLSSHDVRQQHNTTEATNSLYFIKPHANDRIRKRKRKLIDEHKQTFLPSFTFGAPRVE